MQFETLPLPETHQFNRLLLEYLADSPALRPFYGQRPTQAGFAEQLTKKTFSGASRERLVEVLTEQYDGIANPPDFSQLSDSKTFTVTTGHQLNLCTGPLYVVFKIISTIKLARSLSEQFPNYNFVPVYWMASEDHDFEEINHFHLNDTTYTWASEQKGAVGRMNPSEVLDLLKNIPEIHPLFKQTYASWPTLAGAVRAYMHELFGQYGLVCLDADDVRLKAAFSEIMLKDITENTSEKIVNSCSEALKKAGYSAQVTPREINLFYLDDKLRERIERTPSGYVVQNTSLFFTEESLKEELMNHPEKFSPNVILRPLYQEVILPNLAYLGGPGELAYWLQLKPLFEYHGVVFPILMPRNFATLLTSAVQRRLKSLKLHPKKLFEDETQLRREYLRQNADYSLDTQAETQAIDDLLTAILAKTSRVDITLTGHIEAQKTRMKNWATRLDKRLLRSEAQKETTALRQLTELKNMLFPEGHLQERHTNIMAFLPVQPDLIETLLNSFDPFCFEMYVFSLNERTLQV